MCYAFFSVCGLWLTQKGYTTSILKEKKDASVSLYLEDTHTRNVISPTLTQTAKKISQSELKIIKKIILFQVCQLIKHK